MLKNRQPMRENNFIKYTKSGVHIFKKAGA
jgi:hypothetical protein